MKLVSVNVNLTVVFVIIINDGIMINAGANVKNKLMKVYVIKNQFGIQVIVSVNAINM